MLQYRRESDFGFYVDHAIDKVEARGTYMLNLAELGIPKEYTICLAAAIGFIGAESPAPARKEGTIKIIR